MSLLSASLPQTKMSPTASTGSTEEQDHGSPATEALLTQPEGLPTQETPMN